MPITDQDQTIRALRARVEELENERDNLTTAIADHVEALGHEGNDAAALRDGLGQIERLLDGKDLDGDFEGVAAAVRVRVLLSDLNAAHGDSDNWQSFREAGLLWWVNRSLHLLGWAIFVHTDTKSGGVVRVYPKRVDYRGFPRAVEEARFETLTKWLHANAGELVDDVSEG